MARRKKNKNLKGIPAAIMLILALIGGFAERGNLMERMSGEPAQNIADTVATGQMKVTYLNVGQGDCTIIQTEGHNAMIDAGNNHEGKDVVDYLNQQGIDKLDYLILTHPDADHIGGGDDVLEKIEVEQVIMPDVANDTMTYEEVMDDIEKENVPVEHPKVGEEFGFGDATFTVLCPETDLVSSDDTNDASVGIKLVHGENSFVMCGDASENSESAMVKRFGSALECDVLKCGHHGSRTSTSEVFLKATNPTWAVISCGVDNSYGHPHQETVVLLSHKKPDSHINIKVEFGEGEGKVPLKAIAERAEAYKPKERVTYKMIKEYIEAKYGFKVHTAYIAEVKRDLGLPMYDAPNAVEELKNPRKHPTAEKVEAIKDALKYFEVI